MTTPSASTGPLVYLDRAMSRLRDLNLIPTAPATHEAPIVALLQQIHELDPDRVLAITRTLAQASLFNDVVRQQVQAMEIGTRYEKIAESFDSIRDDAKAMVDQVEDGKISTFERLSNVWMKVTRGDIADRFEKIKRTYLDVTASAQDQIQRENLILESYQDFRGALKQGEVMAFEVLQSAQREVDAAKGAVGRRHGPRRGRAERRPRRASAPRAGARRTGARAPGHRPPLPGGQGPLREPHDRLQHLRGRDGAAHADAHRQGARAIRRRSRSSAPTRPS